MRLVLSLVAAGLLAGCGAPRPSPAAAPPTLAARAAAAPTAVAQATVRTPVALAPETPAGGEPTGGEEATVVYVDPSSRFSFEYPQSWAKTTQPDEEVRFTGRDEFISVRVVNTTLSPLDFGNRDAAALSSATSDYTGQPLKAFQMTAVNGAVLAYNWKAGPSSVTGKMVPSSAKRYYLPGPGGSLAIYTSSSPVQLYDPEGADDLARTFTWLR